MAQHSVWRARLLPTSAPQGLQCTSTLLSLLLVTAVPSLSTVGQAMVAGNTATGFGVAAFVVARLSLAGVRRSSASTAGLGLLACALGWPIAAGGGELGLRAAAPSLAPAHVLAGLAVFNWAHGKEAPPPTVRVVLPVVALGLGAWWVSTQSARRLSWSWDPIELSLSALAAQWALTAHAWGACPSGVGPRLALTAVFPRLVRAGMIHTAHHAGALALPHHRAPWGAGLSPRHQRGASGGRTGAGPRCLGRLVLYGAAFLAPWGRAVPLLPGQRSGFVSLPPQLWQRSNAQPHLLGVGAALLLGWGCWPSHVPHTAALLAWPLLALGVLAPARASRL